MNPLTNARNQQELSEKELSMGLTGSKSSWHALHKDSAYIFVGGLAYELSEGDIICVFSQYGEIVDINLVRDKETGKSKGFCFIAYADQRSTVLAVDNLNTIKLCNRQIRVQHVADYKATQLKDKDLKDKEQEKFLDLRMKGVAPSANEEVPKSSHREYKHKSKHAKKDKVIKKKYKKSSRDR